MYKSKYKHIMQISVRLYSNKFRYFLLFLCLSVSKFIPQIVAVFFHLSVGTVERFRTFWTFLNLLLISNASKIISLFLLVLQNHVKFLSCSFFGFQSLASTNDSTGVYSNAHWFSLRTSSSSSCVKSFLMLNVLRISAGVFHLIIFATVWQHKSSNSLISM